MSDPKATPATPAAAPVDAAPEPEGTKYIIRVKAIKATVRYAMDRLESQGIVLDKKHWPIENAAAKTFDLRGWATPERRRTAEYEGTEFLTILEHRSNVEEPAKE